MLPREHFPDEASYLAHLRDWFAGQALAGMLANSAIDFMEPAYYAADCYRFADAMLRARKGDTP